MYHNKYMLGIDIGTTSTKAVLYTASGRPIRRESVEYPLHVPTPAAAEQDPEQIFQAVVETISRLVKVSEIDPTYILGVSFSAVMHSLIAVDTSGRPLTQCITWADNRSADWAQKIKSEMNGHAIYRRTGTPIHPMSPLVKITWLRHEQPEVFARTAKFISIKEYVFYRLFKRYIVDYSIASATGLFNLQELAWDEEALYVAGITKERLSEPVPTTTVIWGLAEEIAEQLSVLPSTPFIVGASDGVLSNLGLNAIEPGTVAITIGTSGAIRAVTDRPVTDPKGRIFCYTLTEKHWVIGGAINNGGIALRWVRDQLFAREMEDAKVHGEDAYDTLTRLANEVPPGADGLIFHPYLAGERAPLWNADLRGSFFGLGLHHKREHIIRAVLEGIIYNLYSLLLALEEVIGPSKKIEATGGFARSPLWRQIMADIFNQPISVPESFESSCLGAAVLSLYALGAIDSLEAVGKMIGTMHRHTPIKENVNMYRRLLLIYIRLMKKMEDEYSEIAAFQRKVLLSGDDKK